MDAQPDRELTEAELLEAHMVMHLAMVARMNRLLKMAMIEVAERAEDLEIKITDLGPPRVEWISRVPGV
jgi:hypothetical protein